MHTGIGHTYLEYRSGQWNLQYKLHKTHHEHCRILLKAKSKLQVQCTKVHACTVKQK